jgi:hypothetical protein
MDTGLRSGDIAAITGSLNIRLRHFASSHSDDAT